MDRSIAFILQEITQEISVIINSPKFKLIQFTYHMQKSTHRSASREKHHVIKKIFPDHIPDFSRFTKFHDNSRFVGTLYREGWDITHQKTSVFIQL